MKQVKKLKKVIKSSKRKEIKHNLVYWKIGKNVMLFFLFF